MKHFDSQQFDILIVDDDPENVALLERVLSRQGYRTRALLDGNLVRNAALEIQPDLILLDILMPAISGYTVCRQLKADVHTRDIPVLFISALADLKDKTEAFAAGGVDYIVKPFEIREVLARVKTHLNLRAAQRQLEMQNAQLQQEIRERVRTEEALRASEARYRTLFEQANDAIFLENDADEILDVNRRACELLGYTRQELLTMKVPDLQAPEVRGQVGQVIKDELGRGGAPFETVDLHRDGTRIPVEVSTSYLGEGTEGLVISIVRDITERKRAEQALRASEEKWRGVIEQASDGISLTDAAGIIIEWNRGQEQITGIKRDGALGRPLWDVQFQLAPAEKRDAEVLEYNRQRYIAAVQTEQGGWFNQTIENEIQRPNGARRIVQTVGFPIRTAQGLLLGAVMRDITESKRAEEALQESERRLADIINFLPDATLVIDKEGVVIAWNRAIEEMTGVAARDMLGKGNYEYALPFYGERRPILIDLVLRPRDEIEVQYSQVKRVGEILIAENYVPLPRGEELHLWGAAAVLYDSKGNVVGAIESIRDVTERVRAQRAAEAAQHAAEAANRAKSTFLANMSHELRTPLNAILGFSELLAYDSNLTTNQQESLAIIGRSGEHLLALINDVLEFSKIEAGRVELQPENFDLWYMLLGLEEMFRLRAAQKGLDLIFDRAADVPQYICADQGKLRQVLINLLGNAVKFTERGSVTLRVIPSPPGPLSDEERGDMVAQSPSPLWGEGRGEGKIRLQFTVIDTGMGIAAEEISTVFDPFAQTASGRQTQQGTGLGVPISRQYVQMMKGNLAVHSELNAGSSFQFEVPVQLVESAEVDIALPPRRVVGLATGQPKYRVLIAEDVESSRKLMVKLLHPLGFAVREAADGREAIAIWEEWQPHLIWMDIRMPIMDGYGATRRIKAAPRSAETIIIALTAGAFEEQRAEVLEAGCDDFLRKPFKETDLFELMSKHLGVRYIYEDTASSLDDSQSDEEELSPATLAALPVDLLRELEQVTIRSRSDDIERLIERIRTYDEVAADTLARLAGEFEYEKILNLIERP